MRWLLAMTAICALALGGCATNGTKPHCVASHQALVIVPTVCKDGVCSTPIVAVICDKAVLPFRGQ
jgi:hypothetical protein